MARVHMAHALLLACLLAAAAGSARAAATPAYYHRPTPQQTCPSLEGLLRTQLGRAKLDWLAQRAYMLPRRGGVTILLPLPSKISGPLLRPEVPPSVLDRFVKEIVLTRQFGSVRAASGAGQVAPCALVRARRHASHRGALCPPPSHPALLCASAPAHRPRRWQAPASPTRCPAAV